MRSTTSFLAAALALALLGAPHVHARDAITPVPPALQVPASGVIGVQEAYLSPEFWVARLQAPDAELLTRAQIQAQNAELFQVDGRSEEHTSELQSLMRNSYAVFCLKKKKNTTSNPQAETQEKN